MRTERKVLLDSGIQSITDGEIVVKHLITGQTTKFENATLISFSNNEVVIEIPYHSPFNYKPKDGEIIYVEGMQINCLMRFKEFSDCSTRLIDHSYLSPLGGLVQSSSFTSHWGIHPDRIIIRHAHNDEIRKFHDAEKAAGVYWDVISKSYKQIFTINMLKPGMVVEHANGNIRLVIQSEKALFLMASGTWLSLQNYREDLTHSDRNYTINKVYKIAEPGSLDALKRMNNLKLIWSRD